MGAQTFSFWRSKKLPLCSLSQSAQKRCPLLRRRHPIKKHTAPNNSVSDRHTGRARPASVHPLAPFGVQTAILLTCTLENPPILRVRFLPSHRDFPRNGYLSVTQQLAASERPRAHSSGRVAWLTFPFSSRPAFSDPRLHVLGCGNMNLFRTQRSILFEGTSKREPRAVLRFCRTMSNIHHSGSHCKKFLPLRQILLAYILFRRFLL